jgi:hypothetical protein
MSKKTSAAALDSFCKRKLIIRRRAPRHPAGERRRNEVRKQGSDERTREFGQAQIVARREDAMDRNAISGATRNVRVILPVILRITFCLAMWTLGAMTMTIAEAQTQEHRVVRTIPVRRARVETCSAREMPVTKRGASFAKKRLCATRSIEVSANGFHQTDKNTALLY